MIISFLSQKGGAGKSSLARAIAVELERNKWGVHVADLDKGQRTFFEWSQIRQENGVKPAIDVAVYGDPKAALKARDRGDVLLIDGKAFADKHVEVIANESDLIIIPTGITKDDLVPSLALATELVNKGILRDAILFVISKIPEGGIKEAMHTENSIKAWGFNVVKGGIFMKTGYGQAMDKGLAFTEIAFKTLREKADLIIQQIFDKIISISEATLSQNEQETIEESV